MEQFHKIQPLTYTFKRDATGSTDGQQYQNFKAGEVFTARTRGDLSLMWEFEKMGVVEIGNVAVQNKQTKVTRPAKRK